MSDIQIPSNVHPVTKRIIKNTIYNSAGNWIVLILNFLIIPFVISKLGIEIYGSAWVIGILIISSAGLVDFGIGSSTVKYIAEYNAKKEYSKINSLIVTNILFYAIFGIALFIIIIIFGNQILMLIGVPTHLSHEAYFVLVVATSILVILNTFSPLTSVLTGLQRMDITNLIMVLAGILNITQTVIVLSLGFGVYGLIIGNLVINLISISLLSYWSFRILPQLKLNITNIELSKINQTWRFGINLQISRISQLVVFQLDRIFALSFFGPANAAFYEVGVKVTTLARSLPLMLTSALLPVASEIDAKNEDVKIILLFERGSKYLIIVGTLLLGFIFLESRLIVQTWIGKSLGETGIQAASIIIKILVFGYFMNTLTAIASTIGAGITRTDLERNVGILALILSPILTISFIYTLGYYGIALSTTLMLTIGAFYYMKQFFVVIGKDYFIYIKLLLKPFISLLIASGILVVVQLFLIPPEILTRLEGFSYIIFYFFIFLTTYITALILSGTLDGYDKSIIRVLVRKVKSKNI